MTRATKLFGAVAAVLLFAGAASAKVFTGVDSLINAGRVAAFVGTICDKYVELHYPGASIVYVNSEAELFLSVRSGKADFAVIGGEFSGHIARENPDFEVKHVTTNPDEMLKMGFIFAKDKPELLNRFNEFIRETRASGELDSVINGWKYDFDNMPTPRVTGNGSGGVIRFATTANEVPNTAVRNGEAAGFDVDIAYRFASRHNYRVQTRQYAFAGLVPAVAAGREEMAGSGIAITEERAKSVNFSAPYYYTAFNIVGLRDDPARQRWTDFVGKRIAVQIGDHLDEREAQRILNAREVFPFTEFNEMLEAVKLGKVDAALKPDYFVNSLSAQERYSDLEVIYIPQNLYRMEDGLICKNAEIRDQFNAFLAKIRADGTFDEMTARWRRSTAFPDTMPPIRLTGENGTLIVAGSAGFAPMAFIGRNNEVVGYQPEMIMRFAQYLGKNFDYRNMAYGAILPYVASGKADISAASFDLTEERTRNSIMTDGINEILAVLVVRKAAGAGVNAAGSMAQNLTNAATAETRASGAMGWLKTGIERNLIKEKRWMLIADGLKVTVIISVLAQIFATALGLFVCYLLSQKNRFISYTAKFYKWLIHGTPMVVLLLIVYYIIFGKTDISPILVAVAAFAMVGSVNIGANLYAAILTIDKTEVEAARSMGFSPLGAFLSVTFPQAVKRALPGYLSGFVDLMKETAIVGFIAIQDLSRAGDIIRSRTYDAYFPLLFVAAIYLVVTTVCIMGFKFIIKKINARGQA